MSLLTDQANALSLTIPLVKIDEERRLVIGRAAQEVPDKTNEILDYETGKPAFEAWSKSFEDMSNGLSKGNLRVMHEKTVAGKIVDIHFDDNAKAIDVVAKVVDDNEWKKVLDGCYTGFSVGGGYGRKWKDGNLTRYTPVVRELSLVDNPCIPTARFAELVKADGMVGQVQLRGTPRTFGQVWADRPRQPQTFGELMKAFDESKHPRGQGGKFANAGGASASPEGNFSRAAGAVVGSQVGLGLGALASHLRGGSLRSRLLYPVVGSALGALSGAAMGGKGAQSRVGRHALIGVGVGGAAGAAGGAFLGTKMGIGLKRGAALGGAIGAASGAYEGAINGALMDVNDAVERRVARWRARRAAARANANANAPTVRDGRRVVRGHDVVKD